MKTEYQAVIISDLHFNTKTVGIATTCLYKALEDANAMSIPLYILGDTHDTKSSMSAQCIVQITECLSHAKTPVVILRGNHDAWNEKSENSSLDYLEYTKTSPILVNSYSVSSVNMGASRKSPDNDFLSAFIAYCSDVDYFKSIVNRSILGHSTRVRNDLYPVMLFMHQGVTSTDPGHYAMDPTAISSDLIAGFRTISGHYHVRQTINLRTELEQELRGHNQGVLTYVGNPYTLNFGEASHPDKGYHYLTKTGELEFIPTMQPRHVIVDNGKYTYPTIAKHDHVLVKIKDNRENISKANKNKICDMYGLTLEQTRLDLEILDDKVEVSTKPGQTDEMLFNEVVQSYGKDDDEKSRLAKLTIKLGGG